MDDLQEIGETMNELTIYQFSKSKNIIFLTPQKFINTLQKTCLKVFDFDLVVFDEAHHTADDHPYNKIMSIYFKEKLQYHANKTMILGYLDDVMTSMLKYFMIFLLAIKRFDGFVGHWQEKKCSQSSVRA